MPALAYWCWRFSWSQLLATAVRWASIGSAIQADDWPNHTCIACICVANAGRCALCLDNCFAEFEIEVLSTCKRQFLMLQDDLSLYTACPETDSSTAPVRRGVRHGVQRTRVKLNCSLNTQCLINHRTAVFANCIEKQSALKRFMPINTGWCYQQYQSPEAKEAHVQLLRLKLIAR